MSWWENDPLFGTEPRARITVRPESPIVPEGYLSNPRGISIEDVQAALRGDMLNAPGLPVKYAAQPGQTFGVDATKNAQPIQSIVAHHTGGPTLESALNTARRGDPFRSDVKYGYHFYIDRDGTVVQGAPLDARTNHVQPPGAAQRTNRPDISNSNSIGISFVGDSSNPTPQQVEGAKNLSRILMERYGISPDNIVGHGEIQNNRQTAEGMPLVNAVRTAEKQPQSVVAQALSGMGTQQAKAQEAPKAAAWWDADPVAKPKKDIGRGTAAAEGFMSGMSANFRDEIYGASKASGLPDILGGFRAPVGAARLAYESLTGQPGEATKAYEEGVAEKRAVQKAAQEQYPGTYIAGQVGGGVFLPGGAAMQAATVPARMARGAAVGGTYGAAAGAGEGENVEDRAGRAAVGLGLGAAVGAAASPIVEGVIQAGRAVAAPVGRAFRGAMDPEGEAARRVVGALQRDARADPGAATSLTPQEFVHNVGAGGPARIIDMGGETTRGLARSAANTSPEARGLLNRAIDDRFEGQSERLVNWLNTTFNYPNAMAQQLAIQNTARAVNRPAYHRAYRDGLRVPLWNAELEQLAQAPEMQAAIRIAIPQLRNWAVRDGFAPPTGAFQIVNGRTTLQTTPNGNTVLPSLQLWDYVKRGLDQMGTPTAQAFSRALRTQLDDLVPSYRQARQGAAHFFGAEDALEAGQNFVTQRFDMRQTRAALANMSQDERQLFQDGFVSRYIEMLNSSGDRRNILNRIAESPTAREQLEVALGRQRAHELEGMLRVEGIMDLARGAVQGNSTTARQLAELGFAGGAGSLGAYGAYNMDPTQMAYGAVMGALLAGGRRIDSNLAQVVARQLTSNDPRVLAVGLRLLARNDRMMDNLRSVDRRIAASGSEQVPTNFAVQSLGAGRAEQGEPEVPGPRGQ